MQETINVLKCDAMLSDPTGQKRKKNSHTNHARFSAV